MSYFNGGSWVSSSRFSAGIYLDETCSGQLYGQQPPHYALESYPAKGVLFQAYPSDAVYYGNFNESQITNAPYYTKGFEPQSNCSGPQNTTGVLLSILPLRENSPGVTGWPYDRFAPNPTIGP